MSNKFNLDKLDLQIIKEMMLNANISYAELGKKIIRIRRHHSCAHKKAGRNGHCYRHPPECKPENARLRCGGFHWHLP